MFVCLITLVLFLHSCSTPLHQSMSYSQMHILEPDANYDVIWEKENYWIDSNERMPLIVSAPGKLVIEGRSSEYQKLFIATIDSTTGDVIWQKAIWTNMPGQILITNNTLFRGTFGAAVLQTYNIDTGEIIWETKLPRAHSTRGLYYANNKAFVFTSDNEFFILDETGEIVSTSDKTYWSFLIMDGILYEEGFLSIKAIDHSSKNEVWRVDLRKHFREAPIFDSGTIFLRTEISPNDIYSINQSTGEIIWKVSQDVLSNLYVTDNKIYFLNRSGELVVLDRYSGEETSKDKFSPPFDLGKPSGGYFVAGDPANDILVIAFGDNTQVLALKIQNP